jgi:4-alpha-glucanotransferase
VNLPRSAGVLLHTTSLPSPYGIGDFGPDTFRFIDQLASAGIGLWQVLPLGPTGFGNSPYQSFSAFAGEPLLISPDLLVENRLLAAADLRKPPKFCIDSVDYEKVRAWKLPLLLTAFKTFKKTRTREQNHTFQQFCADQASWLEDYALFMVLRGQFGSDKTWTSWEKPFAMRNPATLAKAREQHPDDIECQKFWQFLFYTQWMNLHRYCAQKGMRVIGDIPIYVSHDSADVWAHPKQFQLDEDGNSLLVSGVPPDYFSETGQLWGNPIYNWQEMERSGFHWWIDRFRGTFHLYDALRIDHFRGFEAYWEVSATEKTAVNGRWVKAPGEKLFRTVTGALGEMEIIAENLGVITPEVEALREKFNYPGMAILQFAFGIEGNAANYRPHNLERVVVAYTGTHDNDTTVGWWTSNGGDSTRTEEDIRQEKEFVEQYLGDSNEPIQWRMIRALFGSVARVAIVPMQDLLGLGSESRMNRPGVATGNWSWRMLPDAFSPELIQRVRQLAETYDRVPKPAKEKDKEQPA